MSIMFGKCLLLVWFLAIIEYTELSTHLSTVAIPTKRQSLLHFYKQELEDIKNCAKEVQQNVWNTADDVTIMDDDGPIDIRLLLKP